MSRAANSQVDILMATYNGDQWLCAQLSSIAEQVFTNWRLIVRDDGSTDDTLSILREFQQSRPQQVKLISDELGKLGAAGNFAELMRISTSEYCTFSDQDDVWDEDKLEVAISAMRELESENGFSTPLMVATDRRAVNEDGELLASSLWETGGFVPKGDTTVFDLIALPICAGSSMLINAVLRLHLQTVPLEAIQYDCWIELVALGIGKVSFVKRPTLSHVRHQFNLSGGRTYSSKRYIRRAVYLASNLRRQKKLYGTVFAQARTLLRWHGDNMAAPVKMRLLEFIALEGAGPLCKIRHVARGGPLPPTLERKIVFLLLA